MSAVIFATVTVSPDTVAVAPFVHEILVNPIVYTPVAVKVPLEVLPLVSSLPRTVIITVNGPLEVAVADNVLVTVLVHIVPLQGFDDVQDDIVYPDEATP